jgi:hypothetical protein
MFQHPVSSDRDRKPAAFGELAAEFIASVDICSRAGGLMLSRVGSHPGSLRSSLHPQFIFDPRMKLLRVWYRRLSLVRPVCSLHGGTVSADNNSVAIMFDFVDPISADRRLWSLNRLSRDDEPGRKRVDFHCLEGIGRRDAGNNELSVVFCFLPAAPTGYTPDRRSSDRPLGDGRGAEGWLSAPIKERDCATVDFPCRSPPAAGRHFALRCTQANWIDIMVPKRVS